MSFEFVAEAVINERVLPQLRPSGMAEDLIEYLKNTVKRHSDIDTVERI